MGALLTQYGMMMASGSSGPFYFNPSDRDASFSLSGGNAIATSSVGSGWVSGRSATSHSAGKWYAELENTTHSLTQMLFGVCTSAHTLNNFIGNQANGWGLHCNKSGAVDGYTANTPTNLGGTGIVAGGRAYIAVDFDAGKIWFGLSTSGWLGTGNPSTGANPQYTFTPNTTLFLGGSVYSSAQVVTLKNQVGENTGTIPTGFSMWA